jgi:hypothetical protein
MHLFCLPVGDSSKDDDETVEGAVCPEKITISELNCFIFSENYLLQIPCVLFVIESKWRLYFDYFLSVSLFCLNVGQNIRVV